MLRHVPREPENACLLILIEKELSFFLMQFKGYLPGTWAVWFNGERDWGGGRNLVHGVRKESSLTKSALADCLFYVFVRFYFFSSLFSLAMGHGKARAVTRTKKKLHRTWSFLQGTD